MLTRFLSPQKIFFEQLNALTEDLVKIAQKTREILNANQIQSQTILNIREIKESAKKKSEALFSLIHKTFITPFDREDIHALNHALSDTINTLNLIVQRWVAYEIQDIPHNLKKLTDIVYNAAKLIETLISLLSNLKNQKAIIEICQLLKAYESTADQILITGVATLYKEEKDFKQILKLKELFDLLESTTDRFQKIAFIIEGIILEYA